MGLNSLIVDTVQSLLAELTDGPTDVAYVLNRGDCGLLASLRSLSAPQASARPAGRSSIASHVLMAIPTLRQLDAAALREAIGSVVHLAYHLGAIRQLDAAAAGPRS